MALRDTLQTITPVAGTDPFLYTTINSRIAQLKQRDEQLAASASPTLRREIIKVEINGSTVNATLPTNWSILSVSTGRWNIYHDLNGTNYIVIPSSSSLPIINDTSSNSIRISTYNRNGVAVAANFSCLVKQY